MPVPEGRQTVGRFTVLPDWLRSVGHLKIRESAEAIRWLNQPTGTQALPVALAYLPAAFALIGDDRQAGSPHVEATLGTAANGRD